MPHPIRSVAAWPSAMTLLLAVVAQFGASPAAAADIVFLIGEKEYDTRETLPTWAADWLEPAGHRCTFVHALREQPSRFPGAAAIDTADLLVVSVRRRAMTKADLDRVRAHIAAGKPVIGVRTSSHAFDPKDEVQEGDDTWRTFDVDVLGARYVNHLRNKEGTTIDPIRDAAAHPILTGVPPQPFHSGGTLYRMFDIAPDVERLANGLTTQPPEGERKFDDPTDADGFVVFPVAWCRTLDTGSRVFATTLGHVDDFKQPAFQRMLANAVSWTLGEPIGPVASNRRSEPKNATRDGEPAAVR